jgi:sugar diacid utilization regulator
MLLDELRDMPQLGLVPVVAGAPGGPRVRGVYTTDLPDPGRYLDGGELVLTSTTWYREPRDADVFVAALAGAGAAALVAGTAVVGELPDALTLACERHGLSLFTVGDDVSFAAVTQNVLAALAGPAHGSPGAGLHRALVTSMASGAGPEGLVDVFARTTGQWAAILSATGRRTAGQVPDSADRHLERAFRDALAAGSFPCAPPVPGGSRLTFLAVRSPVARRPAVAYLVAGGDYRDWAPGVMDAAVEVCGLLAMDGIARQERRRVEERFLRESLELLRQGQTEAAEGRLRSLGLAPTDPYRAVYVATQGGPYGAGLAATVLDEVADQIPASSVPVAADDAYLVLVPEDPEDPEDPENKDRDGETAVAYVEAAARRLTSPPGQGWAAIGVGSLATGAAGLRRSLDEAEHTLRIARQGQGTVRTATEKDLSSHALLLASVPDEVRRLYRDRLLGPLERYDAEHRSDLVGTLTAFLDASGSWHRCAEQLHVHVNTLRYRLQRVEQLTGHSLATLNDRVDFCLALGIR